MPRHASQYEDDEDDEPREADAFDDRELPDEADQDDEEDDAPLVECPYCGREISGLVELCPHCRSYISSEDAPAPRRPVWLVAGVIVCLVIVLLAWVLG